MSEGSTSAPAASTFVFLHEVPALVSGTKVRLLGCIVEYDLAKGYLLLEHAYPKDASPVPTVWVDISLVLENTKSTTIAPGTWINVIGYVQALPRQTRSKSGNLGQNALHTARLQAVLIWDAGAVRLEDYENTLEKQKCVQRGLRSTKS